jgi:hypothetical protein
MCAWWNHSNIPSHDETTTIFADSVSVSPPLHPPATPIHTSCPPHPPSISIFVSTSHFPSHFHSHSHSTSISPVQYFNQPLTLINLTMSQLSIIIIKGLKQLDLSVWRLQNLIRTRTTRFLGRNFGPSDVQSWNELRVYVQESTNKNGIKYILVLINY